MIKVLHIGKSYPLIGGVETVIYNLCSGLSDLGIQSDFLCASSELYKSETIIIKPGFKIYTVKSLTKKASTFLSSDMIKMLNYLHPNYDIIHIHHPDPMATLALYLSRFKGPVVCHWHSDILKQKFFLHFFKPLQHWMLNRADVIIGTSPTYIAYSPYLQPFKDKTQMIPIGIPPVDQTFDAETAQQIDQLAKGRKIVFALGRLIYYKGFDILIQAAKYLPEDAVVIIGGSGRLEREYRQLIQQSGLQNKVFLVGRIPQEKLPTYFKKSILFCMPSVERTEAFGIAQVEAMAYGKPVVATHIPGSGVDWVNKEQVSGLNVAIKDVNALAKAITSILTDSQLYSLLSEGALHRFRKEFTEIKMAEQTLKIYQQLLHK